MSRYRLTEKAKADARAVRARIASDRPAAADRFMDEFYGRFRLAATQPEYGEARSDLGRDLRLFSVGNYVIVIRPIQEGIEVVRVIHGSRDIGSLF